MKAGLTPRGVICYFPMIIFHLSGMRGEITATESKKVLMWACSQMWPSQSWQQEQTGHFRVLARDTEDIKDMRLGARESQGAIPTLPLILAP